MYLFIYDYQEKQVLYKHQQDLLPLIDSFDLPQLNDKANLCENVMVYNRKGISIKVVAKVDEESGNCVTTFDWSVKDEFNFRGTHIKHFKNDENYSDVRALDKEKKFFYFNQKEYLNKCGFSLDIHKHLVVPPSNMETILGRAESSDPSSIYSAETYQDLKGPTVRFGTPDLSAQEDCYGHYDYGRGVFLYKTNWFWTWGQGTTTITNEDNEPETVKLAVNFGGALSHVDHLKSNEDYFKLGNKIITLHPVEMIYDKLNHMNGFVFRTAEEFRNRETQTVDLVFTSNKELISGTNFFVLKVSRLL